MKRVLVLAIALLAAAAPAAQARPGALDPSFGRGGKVLESLELERNPWHLSSVGIAKLPQGKTVALVDRTLLVFRRDGTLASGFGGGRVMVHGPARASLSLVDVATDRNGRVLVGGTVTWASEGFGVPHNEDVFLARFTGDGVLDSSFDGDGILISDFGAEAPTAAPPPLGPVVPPPPQTRLAGIAIDASERIVLSGIRVAELRPCRGFGQWSFLEAFTSRLGTDGALDPTFGEGGSVWLQGVERAAPPLSTPSGSTYLSGQTGLSCVPESGSRYLVRLDPLGRTDPTFGGGWLRVHEPYPPHPGSPIALDRSGRVLLLTHLDVAASGSTWGKTVAQLHRFLPSGKPDRSFGRDGSVVFVGGRNNGFVGSAIASEGSGGIVIAGTSEPVMAGAPSSFLVGRLREDGSLDRRFGKGGKVVTRFGRRSQAAGKSLALVPGGILVAGPLRTPSLPHGEGLALARYLRR